MTTKPIKLGITGIGMIAEFHAKAIAAMDGAELRAFDERVRKLLGREEQEIEYAAEPKLDGAGVELIYRDGVFAQGLTRGDGRRGEDVTGNLSRVLSIPLELAETSASSAPFGRSLTT